MIATNSLIFISYINSLAPGTFINLECPQCSKTFTRAKNVIQSKLGNYNNEKTIYCSRSCASMSFNRTYDVNCLNCKIIFKKVLNQIIKSPNHFCSRSCAATYNNTHKKKGNRRSKLEVWLEEKLRTNFTSVEILFNNKEIINAELDIYFPSLKIAFELNGIFHYEPIYGKEKLASIQNNDNRKFQACLERGIELVIIDTSMEKYFTEKSSQKYLEIIINIITEKLEQATRLERATTRLEV